MRPAAIVLCFAITGLAGCGDPQREAIRGQIANFEELADLLAQAKDAPSMTAVEEKIEERMVAFQRAANRVGSFAPPDEKQAQAYQDEFGPRLKSAFDRYVAELRRIRALPGGPEFVDRIGKKAPGKTP
jgi:hypothetical protein